MLNLTGRLPDAIAACVGGGSNAIGIFHAFLDDPDVRLVGLEAGGDGIETGRHASTISGGQIGVLHGARTYLLQDDDGQIVESHSISAGLDYPGVGPEHSHLAEIGRAEFRPITDTPAMDAFAMLSRTEGIIPAIESAHAIAGGIDLAREIGPDGIVLINVSGRGDKDMGTAMEYFGLGDPHAPQPPPDDPGRGRGREAVTALNAPAVTPRARTSRLQPMFDETRADEPGRAGRLPARRVPDIEHSKALFGAMIDGGCDLVEVGLPFSDPVHGRAGHPARRADRPPRRVPDHATSSASSSRSPTGGGRAVVMTYFNPVLAYGVDAFARDLAAAGGLGVITPDLIVDEAGPWLAASRTHGIDSIFLVAPSSSAERIAHHRRRRPAASSTPPRPWASPAPATRCSAAPGAGRPLPQRSPTCRSASGSGSGPRAQVPRSPPSPTR